jgi:hypothetical protein
LAAVGLWAILASPEFIRILLPDSPCPPYLKKGTFAPSALGFYCIYEVSFLGEDFDLTEWTLCEDCFFLLLFFLISWITYLPRENFLASKVILEDISSCLNDSIGDVGTTRELFLSFSSPK